MWGSDTLLPRDSPLDGKVVALGALTLLRGHISYPNRRMERVERAVADQRDWPPDVTLPFKVAYRSRKDPIWKRLMTYFESCRMVDSSVYEKIGGISESWLQLLLMAHRLNPIVQANNTAVGRNLALSTLDMVVSKVILLRMGELSGMTKTQREILLP